MTAPRGRSAAAVTADLLVVLLLLVLAVVGLSTTFVGWGFLVVAGVAAALAELLVVLTARLPAASLLAAGPLGAIFLAGPLALRAQGLGGGVPNGQTLADVMSGSYTGWGEMLTTLPRVDLSGPPALVPFLLGFVGAFVATVLVTRSTSAGAPLLPLLGVLAVVLLVRRPAGDLVQWHAVAFAVVAIVWVGVRGLGLAAAGSDGTTAGTRGRSVRGLAALAVIGLALLVAVPLTSGGASSYRGETVRGRIGPLPDVTHLDSPLRSFRDYTKQPLGTLGNLNARTLIEVSGAPAGSRIRFLTLDRYDGKQWRPGNDTMADTFDDRFQRVDTAVDNPTSGTAVRVRVTVRKPYRSAWVPTIGSLTALRFLHADPNSRRDELRYDLATSTAVLPPGVGGGNDYEFTAIVPDTRLTRTMAAWPRPVLSVEDQDRADRLIGRVLDSPSPAIEKVFVLAKYLRDTGFYSDGVGLAEARYRPGHDAARLFKGFLLAKRAVGDDEQYAAAMALLANRVGVPARVVMGAVLPRSGRVRGSDVQAWVELRVADGSWRTLPTQTFMSDRAPESRLPPPAPPRMPTSEPTPPNQVDQQKQVQKQAQDQKSERSAARWRTAVVRLLPWSLLVLMALGVPLAKLVRRRRRRTRGRPSDRIAGAWIELVDHARDLGIPVRVQASRPAQARVMARVMALAGALSREADDGVFAEQEPVETEVRAYWEQVMRERRALGGGQSRRRRIWAPFNPVTLLPGRSGD